METIPDTDIVATAYPLIDGHTHIDQYASQELQGLLERAQAANVRVIIAAGTTPASCERVIGLAEAHPCIYAGVGLHPADLQGPIDDAAIALLRRAAANPRTVVWSETGLDYMPASPSHAVQQDAFRQQIRLAREANLPLVIHSREADTDTLRLLEEEGAAEVGGAWHYFQGNVDLAEAAMDLGFYISLAKPLLRLTELQEAVRHIPLERIVVETDSYPQPFKKHRVRWTEPWHLPQVVEKIAELQGVQTEQVAQTTTANYVRMVKGRIPASAIAIT